MKNKASKTNKYTKCKCCGLLKDKLDISICLSILKNTDLIKKFKLDYDLYDFLTDSNLVWTCDKCIQDKKSIITNPSLQNSAYEFYLAYYDDTLSCKKCENKFTFTKEEKKLWYGELKFYVQSVPLNCLKCRKEIRLLKLQTKILSQLLKKNVREMSIEELSQIAEIYYQWDKSDKFNFYNKIIKARQN